MKIMGETIPTWVLIGAVVLAFCAGVLNTTALTGITHISASHMTGNVSLFVASIIHGDWLNFQMLLISIGSFWFGSVLSGAIIGSSELNIRRNYGYAMLLEGVMLCISLAMYLNAHLFFGQMLIAMACGLQNSMVATYNGTVIRTTHLTGLTSDLGAAVGNWLVGRRVSLKRIILHSALWWAFFVGGGTAVVLYAHFGYLSMLLPITVILLAALFYNQMDKLYHKVEQKVGRLARLAILTNRYKK
ncbi:YoaK family protein [Moraxella marmotae]|uniref:YoaK family protein n=1 Tax=Moraxella marmotae TaxID=3344520 RepID=UPI0035F4CC1A